MKKNNTSIFKGNKLATMALSLLTSMLSVWTPCEAQNAPNKDNDKLMIFGRVYDSFIGIPLKAHVYLMNADSTVVDSASCAMMDNTAVYQFRVPNTSHQYIIKASLNGYDDKAVAMNMRQTKNTSIPNVAEDIFMKKKKEVAKTIGLDEVTVTATKVQLAYRGDTLVYDASAFVMPEGSLLSDLIKQMPGAELKDNGDIYIKGQRIDYLTLNGQNFFKGKNKMMLDNLPYFTVKDIKVYNKEKSAVEKQMTGSDRKYFVMDVNLKKKYMNTSLANAEAGIGTNERWKARVFSLFLGNLSHLSVFGNANNINEDSQPEKNGSWKPYRQQQGTKETKQLGLSFEKENKKHQNREELNAVVEWSDCDINSIVKRSMFSPDGDIKRHSSSIMDKRDFLVDVKNTMMFSNPRKRMTQIDAAIKYDDNKSDKNVSDSTITSSLINSTATAYKLKGCDFTSSLKVNNVNFLSGGDILGFTAKGAYSFKRPYDVFNLWSTKYGDSSDAELRNNYNDARQHRYEYSANARYNYMLPKHWQITPFLEYGHRYEQRDNYNYRLDWLAEFAHSDQTGVLPSLKSDMALALDAPNSYHYGSHRNDYTTGVSLSMASENDYFSLDMPVTWSKETMRYEGDRLDTTANRKMTTFMPSIQYQRYGKNKISLSYSTKIQLPDYALLMPFTDTTDPLMIRVNNKNVKRSVNQNFNSSISLRTKKRINYTFGLSADYTHEAWGTRMSYNSDNGVFTCTMDNIPEANWNGTARAGVDFALDKAQRLTLNAGTYVRYEHSVDFNVIYDRESEELSKVNTTGLGLNSKLQYRLKTFIASVSGKVDCRYSRSDMRRFSDINVYDFQYGTSVQYTIPVVDVTLLTDVTVFSRRGYEAHEMNSDNVVWNALATKSFLKGRLTAKIQAFDLLHQLSNKQYVVNAQGRTETWYNNIPRYVMFSLAATINNSKKKH